MMLIEFCSNSTLKDCPFNDLVVSMANVCHKLGTFGLFKICAARTSQFRNQKKIRQFRSFTPRSLSAETDFHPKCNARMYVGLVSDQGKGNYLTPMRSQ